MSLKHELQNVISGNESVRHGKIIQTITDHLRRKKKAIQGAATAKPVKEQEAQILIEFIIHTKISVITKMENTTLAMPLAVPKARFTRLRSLGFTIEC